MLEDIDNVTFAYTFDEYMSKVKSMLECNVSDDEYMFNIFTFTEEQVDSHRQYFLDMYRENISPYKALTFFEPCGIR